MSNNGKNAQKEKKKQTRSSKAELDTRIDNVVDWLLAGYDVGRIKKSCVSTWEVTDRQAATYYAKAYKKIQDATQADLKERIAWHIATRTQLYNQLEKKKTPQGATAGLRILDSIAEIEGIIKVKAPSGGDAGAAAGTAIHSQTYKVTLNI